MFSLDRTRQIIVKYGRIFILVINLYGLSSCKSGISGNQNESINSVNASTLLPLDSLPAGDYCFLRVEDRDTTVVRLRILSDDDIRGEMNWIPWEKDGAYGTLTGRLISANEMELRYDYTIEGSEQSEIKVMKIEHDQLFIKVGELVDPNNDGNLVFKDVSEAQYLEVLENTNCE